MPRSILRMSFVSVCAAVCIAEGGDAGTFLNGEDVASLAVSGLVSVSGGAVACGAFAACLFFCSPAHAL